MAWDHGLAETMRGDLDGVAGISERPMFGGLCFLRDGHMLCGVMRFGAFYRVGRAREAAALALPGAAPMRFTGRAMSGIVQIDEDAAADDRLRAEWTALALAFTAGLPPK
jgi:TfoX/Sxy family transcriptional regulator of competence genes